MINLFFPEPFSLLQGSGLPEWSHLDSCWPVDIFNIFLSYYPDILILGYLDLNQSKVFIPIDNLVYTLVLFIKGIIKFEVTALVIDHVQCGKEHKFQNLHRFFMSVL